MLRGSPICDEDRRKVNNILENKIEDRWAKMERWLKVKANVLFKLHDLVSGYFGSCRIIHCMQWEKLGVQRANCKIILPSESKH
jgi:hypothetical protein